MDISSLLLIEDSADSEGDTTGFFSLLYNIGHHNNVDDDDDAESCTCDQGCGEFFCDDEDCGNYDSDFSMWMSEEEALLEIECYSPSFVDEDEVEITSSGNKVDVNEVEDKLFWEICMAVGYP